MNYSLIKLRFSSAVHFGPSDSALSLYTSDETFRADTLFSALCQTALDLYGPSGAERLCREAQAGELLLSDAMPWRGERFYLPRPMAVAKTDGEDRREVPADQRKAMKKLEWLPVDAFGVFSQSLSGKESFNPKDYTVRFSELGEMTRVQCENEKDNLPYQVGVRYFLQQNGAGQEECGLYVLLGWETEPEEQRLVTLLTALGYSGIGGKTTSGCGRFSVAGKLDLRSPADAQTAWLRDALNNRTADSFLLLTTSLPRDEELDSALEGASFQLVRRGGFLRPDGEEKTGVKKQTQYFLASGSVLKHRFEGALYEVCPGVGHPVYRYGKPIFLGVEL